MVDKSKITMLDEAFSSYTMDHDKDEFCKKVSSILHAFDGNKKFKISITDDKKIRSKEPFFGMRIFPSQEYAERIIREIVEEEDTTINNMCKRWRSISEWEIEIDNRVFQRDSISFNPQELTAMLLHEVGHTVYSDRKMEMFYRVYKECNIRMKETDKAAAKILYTIYMIPLTLVCGFRDWGVTSVDLREEIFADQSVQKLGYSEALISAYSKIIKAYGSGGFSVNGAEEKELARSMDLCNLNISDLRHRRDRLKDELYNTGTAHNSSYIRSMISMIMTKIGIAKKTKYNGNVVLESDFSACFDDENFTDESLLVFDMKTFNALESQITMLQNGVKAELANEAFGRKKKLEVPSQLDVDCIAVELDRIENHADRRYVLDLIYNQEEKIQKFMELCEYNNDLKKKYYGKMQSMLKELEDIRRGVLSKRNFDKNYKVFVKYPAGYEG